MSKVAVAVKQLGDITMSSNYSPERPIIVQRFVGTETVASFPSSAPPSRKMPAELRRFFVTDGSKRALPCAQGPQSPQQSCNDVE